MLTWLLVLRLLRGAGEGVAYTTDLILTDRTGAGDGITRGFISDASLTGAGDGVTRAGMGDATLGGVAMESNSGGIG